MHKALGGCTRNGCCKCSVQGLAGCTQSRSHRSRELSLGRCAAQGFKIVKAAQLAAVALVAVLAFGLAAALGQGIAPASSVAACLVAGERPDTTSNEKSHTCYRTPVYLYLKSAGRCFALLL